VSIAKKRAFRRRVTVVSIAKNVLSAAGGLR
jgi:hypothetical protein